jgi:hypothetical protein
MAIASTNIACGQTPKKTPPKFPLLLHDVITGTDPKDSICFFSKFHMFHLVTLGKYLKVVHGYLLNTLRFPSHTCPVLSHYPATEIGHTNSALA